jgi:Ca2+-transporting ATPase
VEYNNKVLCVFGKEFTMEKGWFNKSYEEVASELNVDVKTGLTDKEILERREKYGTNELKEGKKESLLQKFINQFKDFTIIVLIISAIVSSVVGVMEEGISGIKDSVVIMVIVILNAIIGIIQENKAEKSLEALQKLSDHQENWFRAIL